MPFVKVSFFIRTMYVQAFLLPITTIAIDYIHIYTIYDFIIFLIEVVYIHTYCTYFIYNILEIIDNILGSVN